MAIDINIILDLLIEECEDALRKNDMDSVIDYIEKKIMIVEERTEIYRYLYSKIPEIIFYMSRIPEWFLYNCDEITEIKIPSNVKTIGTGAFADCQNLKSVIISNSVKEIEGDAFYGCNKLVSIEVVPNNKVYDSRENSNAIIETASNKLIVGCQNNIPNGIKIIGAKAFFKRESITNVVIPEGVEKIESGAFLGCPNLKSIVISSTVTDIDHMIVGYSKNLEKIEVDPRNEVFDSRDNSNAIIETETNTVLHACKETIIPNSVVNLGYGAFEGCYGLKQIIIPNNVTNLDGMTFCDCKDLEDVIVSAGLKCIEAFTFLDCKKLRGAAIPNTIKHIKEGAFMYCNSLKEIYIPDCLEKIDRSAFRDCTSLTRITIPDGVTSIGRSAFENCTSLAINCKSSSKQDGWDDDWNSSNCPVVWGYTGN